MDLAPPPGLELAFAATGDLAPPPGLELPFDATGDCSGRVFACTQAKHWSLERTLNELSRSSAVNLRASLKSLQYPSKPPGIFEQPADTFSPVGMFKQPSDALSSASTAASEMGEEIEEKQFIHGLQVEPLDKACARPLKVRWPVEAKKLQCRDKQIVSPTFEVAPGCFFKLMLKPCAVGDGRYQDGFRKARGRGSVELKCVDESSFFSPTLRFWISIGDGSLRGPVVHNFSQSTVCGLTKSEQIFDFSAAVDDKSSTFLVTLQAFPMDTSVAGH
jgi:hypothetical protein